MKTEEQQEKWIDRIVQLSDEIKAKSKASDCPNEAYYQMAAEKLELAAGWLASTDECNRCEECDEEEEPAADPQSPDYAARRAYIDQCIPADAPARIGLAPDEPSRWTAPEEPGRWLMLYRNAKGAVESLGIYEELKIAAEVIDITHPLPVQIDVVDLDEHKLYQPERKTVAFVQPQRAVESRIEV